VTKSVSKEFLENPAGSKLCLLITEGMGEVKRKQESKETGIK